MILQKIVENKRHEVARQKEILPLGGSVDAADRPPTRDFGRAIRNRDWRRHRRGETTFAVRGDDREDFDPVGIAGTMKKTAPPPSPSSPTEVLRGQGRLHLSVGKKAITLPLLRKEFIIDPWQINETRAIGADALLLIARILGAGELRDFIGLASDWGSPPSSRSMTRPMLEKAISSGAEIVGINNRDLETFVTDIETSIRARPQNSDGVTVVVKAGSARGRSRGYGGGGPRLSDRREPDEGNGYREETEGAAGEGIGDRRQATGRIDRIDGIDRRADDQSEIKICGITNIEDALAAASAGADALGFVFHPASPRYVTPSGQGQSSRRCLHPQAVGVFVNLPAEEVERIAELCGLDSSSSTARRRPEYCRRFPRGRLIKAVSFRSEEGLPRWSITRSGPSSWTPATRPLRRHGEAGRLGAGGKAGSRIP